MAKTRRKPKEPNDLRKRPAPVQGAAVVWPAGVEARYGISAVTRWRWEREGTLPARDVHVGGRDGWRPETLEAFERNRSSGAAA
jgi:hypothetical protein